MKRQYRITPEGPQQPTEAEIARYRDPKRLIYNYSKAVRRPKRPLYKDPKTFIMLVLIVLLAFMLAERADDRTKDDTVTPPERTGQ